MNYIFTKSVKTDESYRIIPIFVKILLTTLINYAIVLNINEYIKWAYGVFNMVDIDQPLAEDLRVFERSPEFRQEEEINLAQDLRMVTEKLFEQYEVPRVSLPEDEGRLHCVRELMITDDPSTFAEFNLKEYSDGNLFVSIGFEYEDYVDYHGQEAAGTMTIRAGISADNKLIYADRSMWAEQGGVHQRSKFAKGRDDPVFYLEEIIEIMTFEVHAYEDSTSCGMASNVDGRGVAWLMTSPAGEVDLGSIIPEIKMDEINS